AHRRLTTSAAIPSTSGRTRQRYRIRMERSRVSRWKLIWDAQMGDRDRPGEVNGRRGLVELYAGLVRLSSEHGDDDRPGAVTLPDGQRILPCGRQVYELASHWFEAVVPDRVKHVGRRSVVQPLRRNHRRSRGLNRDAMAVPPQAARAGNLIAPGVPLRGGANGCFRRSEERRVGGGC